MKRISDKFLSLISFVFIVIFVTSANANQDFLSDNVTGVAIYINLGSMYNDSVKSLLNLMESKEPAIIKRSEEIINIIGNNQGSEFVKKLKRAEIAKYIKEWNSKGFFIPNGPIKISISSDLKPYIDLRAKINVDTLMKHVEGLLKGFYQSIYKKNNSVSIHTNNGDDLIISSAGIIFGNKPNPSGTESKLWKGFENIVAQNEALFAVEIDPEKMRETINQGVALTSGFVGDSSVSMKNNENATETTKPDDTKKNKSLSELLNKALRVRFIVWPRQFMMVYKFDTEESQQSALKLLKETIDNINNMKPYTTNSGEVVSLPKAALLDKNPWFGIQFRNEFADQEAGVPLLKIVKLGAEAAPVVAGTAGFVMGSIKGMNSGRDEETEKALDTTDSDYWDSDYQNGAYSSYSFNGRKSKAKYGVGVIAIKPSVFGNKKFEPVFGPKDTDKDLDPKIGSCKSCMTVIRETTKIYAEDKKISDLTKISFNELVDSKYLSGMPICPSRGIYEVLPDGDVKCSIHGKLSTIHF